LRDVEVSLPGGGETNEPEQNTGSLKRGLAILDVIIRVERPITLAEIATQARLGPSTTHRLLHTLLQLGHVYRDPSKRYYPGPSALFPANLFHPLNVLRRVASEELLTLRKRFGLAAALVIFMGGQRWVLEAIHGNDFLSPYSEMLVSASLHASVSGKILLSTEYESARTGLLGPDPYEAHTPRTIVARRQLDRELSLVSERGYATAIDELLLGLGAVGAPIWCAPGRPLGALVLAGPTKHFNNGNLAELIKGVSNTAALFSRASPHIRDVCRFLGH
jgi:DNA-binding IclR family transcriptional regulator